jgi:hypothetical protein
VKDVWRVALVRCVAVVVRSFPASGMTSKADASTVVSRGDVLRHVFLVVGPRRRRHDMPLVSSRPP